MPTTRSLRPLLLLVSAPLVSACIGDIGDGPEDGSDLGEDEGFICGEGPHPSRTDARRLTPVEYKNALRDVFGPSVAPSDHYPGSYGKSTTGFSTEAQLYTVGEQAVDDLMTSPEDVAESVAGSLPSLLPCSTEADPGIGCVDTFLETYVARLYRRPVTEEERASLVATYDGGRATGASFTEALAMVAAHALQSPQFFYITEAAGGEGRELDGYELASRLLFFLWESIPDDELLAKAEAGQLADPEVRASEARRMLADPKADAARLRFLREWTLTEDVTAANKDPDVIPGFDDAYAASMAASFDRFLLDQARTGTLESLLTSRDVWVDANMARLFDLDEPAGWEKRTLDERYSCLATQPLFLASAPHSSSASIR